MKNQKCASKLKVIGGVIINERKKPKAKKSAPAKFNARDHWKGMPEFVSESKQPIKTITVGFANKEDMLRFSKLVGQEITAKTRSIWFPKVENVPMFDKRYTDKK